MERVKASWPWVHPGIPGMTKHGGGLALSRSRASILFTGSVMDFWLGRDYNTELQDLNIKHKDPTKYLSRLPNHILGALKAGIHACCQVSGHFRAVPILIRPDQKTKTIDSAKRPCRLRPSPVGLETLGRQSKNSC
jgi:hypothetical protein